MKTVNFFLEIYYITIMSTTRRRKIARSVAIRRVKQNARRKERKTQKRKSRNKVMRGGDTNLKVYVMQKPFFKPKCFIIRQKSMPKDTIYLFFHSKLNPDEIKEFVYAAMGLDPGAVITPELQFTSSEGKDSEGKDFDFNNLFVKLSGSAFGLGSYSLSSGNLYSSTVPISERKTLKNHDTPKIAMQNGEAIIESLKSKTSTKEDYTFTDFTEKKYFDDNKINLGELERLFHNVMVETVEKIKTHCSEQPISQKIEELKTMVGEQTKIYESVKANSNLFASGFGKSKTKDETITQCTEIATSIDIPRAKKLIAEIKSDTSLSECTVLIKPNIREYIYGEKEFTPKESIKKLVEQAYKNAMDAAGYD
jgi:hypothetical protein